MSDLETHHAVILDAEGIYHSEVVSDIATIEMNVPEGGSYSTLPPGTSANVSAFIFPHEPGVIEPPAE